MISHPLAYVAPNPRQGVKPGKGHGEFILFRPLAVKVKAYDPVVVELLGFDDQGANPLCLVLELLSVVPKPPPGRPLIYMD